MNLCRCENGHFYDKEKYETCPHCAEGGTADESLTTVYTEAADADDLPIGGAAGASDGSDVERTVTGTEQIIEESAAPTPVSVSPTPAPASAYQDDDDHTVAFIDEMYNEVAVGTPATKNNGRPSSPCVGWLVAINGAHIGQDFRLKTGKNFIGRGEDMDIALTDDKSVSRSRHAILVYEPKQHLYLVQPGDSSGLVYHNDDVVLNPVQIKAFDQITVGDVNLVFIPLCSENFNWEDLLQNMKK